MAMDLDIIFENLYNRLMDSDFGKKLGGELPLFIQPLDPSKQRETEEQVKRLASRLNRKGIRVSVVNLFDLSIAILKEEGILDAILENESDIPHSDTVETLDSILDISSTIIPHLQSVIESENPDYLFLSGVGSVYPFIRSHGILNNLDELTDNCKLVLFFPGQYDNMQLKLFGHIYDENYYRGINLNEISYPI